MPTADLTLSFWVPVGSLVVAALAVFIGPFVAWRVAARQSETALKVARRQIVAPMRQEWSDALRDRVSEILSTAHWFYVSGMEHVTKLDDDEDWDNERIKVDRKMLFLLNQVELMLNPKEEDHVSLLGALKQVRVATQPGESRSPEFRAVVERANDLCKKVLKREWERVKNEE